MNRTRQTRKRPAGVLLLGGVTVLGFAFQVCQAAAPVAVPLAAYSGPIQAPARVATDTAGHVYITDPGAGQIAVFDVFGRMVSLKRGLAGPLAIAVDGRGHVWVGEEKTGSVSMFDTQWNQLGKLGVGDGEFAMPNHLAVDLASDGVTVYVSDSLANCIKVYSNASLVRTFGAAGSGPGQFDFPAGVFVTGTGEVFVVDQNNDRVQVFDRNGGFRRAFSLVTRLGGMGVGSAGGRSQAIAGDGAGRVFVADTFQGFVRVFDSQGTYLSRIGGLGGARGQFRGPAGLAIDGLGRLFVASANNGRVEVIGIDSYLHLAAGPSTSAVAEGSDVWWAVGFGGAGPFTCQWRKDGSDLNDGGSVSGSATATLRLTSATLDNSGRYSVVVTGPSGTLTSPEAPLAVLSVPAIVQQPVGQTVLLDSAATFQVLATGSGPMCYQWSKDGVDLEGETNAVLSVLRAQDSDGGNYSVAVANEVGMATSGSAVLVVNHPPLANLAAFPILPPAGIRLSVADVLAANPDTDGDPVFLTSVNPGSVAGGTVLWEGDWILYAPPAGYTNADLVTYTVSDGRGGLATGRIMVEAPGTSAQTRILALQCLDGGVVQVLFAGVPGMTYSVQCSDDLGTTSWQTLTNLTADPAGLYRLLDAPPSGASARFYRSQW